MKIFFSVLIMMIWALGTGAQNSPTWFDGNAYYTSTVPEDGIIHFKGTSADKEYQFSFAFEAQGNDHYKLVRYADDDLFPFRADFGASVIRYSNGNIDVFLIKNEDDQTTWTIKRTTQNHRDALATQLWTKDQPVKKMLASIVLNTHYFSDFSKTELRSLEQYLDARNDLNDIEYLNVSLIRNELRTPDYLRYNVGDIQAIEEAKLASVVHVDNAKSFLRALKSGATICIQPNTVINLSEVLNEPSYFTGSNKAWVEFLDEYRGNAQIISESVHNGRQLTLRNLSDITIIGDYNSHIVVDPPYAFVLNFVNCQNIKLQNLTMGHTEEGYCTGGVVGLNSCVKTNISYCDLYGCGAYGLISQNSLNVGMYNSVIRDCSYGIMQLFNTNQVVFENCDFIRNKEFTMVEIDSNCKDLLFSECRFAQNKGVLFDLRTQIRMENCLIHHTDADKLGNLETHLANEATNTKVVITDMPLGKKQHVGVDSK